MDLKEFHRLSTRTMPSRDQLAEVLKKLDEHDLGALNASLGLGGESGEFVDMIKKWIFHGHPRPSDEKLVEELGDIQFYVVMCCEYLGLDASQILAANVEKLKRRYPEKFNSRDSLFRKV